MKNKIKYLFGENNSFNVLYSTSDGFVFTLKQDAVKHSKELKNNTVLEWKRNEEQQNTGADITENDKSKKLKNK